MNIRTSLEIGFPEGHLPVRYAALRGRSWRTIGAVTEIPYDDSQFDVVLLDPSVVHYKLVKDVHRVLRPDGRLYFTVPEKTRKQDGFTLPEIYSVVREGFHIVELERRPWWAFRRPRTLTICAQKKNWKALTNNYRPYL